MKEKVKLSTGGFIFSVFSLVLMGAAIYYMWGSARPVATFVLITGTVVWLVAALIYMPLTIEVDEKAIWINRPLWSKRIPLSEVLRVQQLQPTMGERRILGSGGFMGYWGRFRDREIGNYFGYYGRASDCFLVRLRNGRQYILGCENPAEMVAAIKERL